MWQYCFYVSEWYTISHGHHDKRQLKKFNPQIKDAKFKTFTHITHFVLFLLCCLPKLKIYASASKYVKIFIITDLDFLCAIILRVSVDKSELLKNKQKKQIFLYINLKPIAKWLCDTSKWLKTSYKEVFLVWKNFCTYVK